MRKKLTNDEFIAKAIAVHGDRYLYDKCRYVHSREKVTITCRLHGDFQQTATNHVNEGQGCARCNHSLSLSASGIEKRWGSVASRAQDFLNRATELHDRKYDYSEVNFVGQRTKVRVLRSEHGAFLITPHNHLKGVGCNVCASNGYRSDKRGYLYVLTADDITKVGITNREPAERAAQISRSAGIQFMVHSVFAYADGSIPRRLEQSILLHLRQAYSQVSMTYDGSTESFVGVDVSKLLDKIAEEATVENPTTLAKRNLPCLT